MIHHYEYFVKLSANIFTSVFVENSFSFECRVERFDPSVLIQKVFKQLNNNNFYIIKNIRRILFVETGAISENNRDQNKARMEFHKSHNYALLSVLK